MEMGKAFEEELLTVKIEKIVSRLEMVKSDYVQLLNLVEIDYMDNFETIVRIVGLNAQKEFLFELLENKKGEPHATK